MLFPVRPLGRAMRRKVRCRANDNNKHRPQRAKNHVLYSEQYNKHNMMWAVVFALRCGLVPQRPHRNEMFPIIRSRCRADHD
eukprot:scaffold18043_cov46-Attheya_sp.AAC.4